MNPIIIEKNCNIKYINDLDDSNYISEGGFGVIYKLDDNKIIKISKKRFNVNRDDEHRCLTGHGCINDIFMEGLILSILNKINSKHIPKFYGLYYCEDNNSYALLMEHIKGKTFTDIQYKLNINTRLSILFQLTYTLYNINKYCKFLHGDLIGQNIMISLVPRSVEEYIIEDNDKVNTLLIDNCGVHVHLIDFGYSRLEYLDDDGKITIFQGYNNFENYPNSKETISSLKNLMLPENRFDIRADICKIYANPNFNRYINYDSVYIKGISLNEIISECKAVTSYYVAVPPFPEISHIDLLLSTLWDSIKNTY